MRKRQKGREELEEAWRGLEIEGSFSLLLFFPPDPRDFSYTSRDLILSLLTYERNIAQPIFVTYPNSFLDYKQIFKKRTHTFYVQGLV